MESLHNIVDFRNVTIARDGYIVFRNINFSLSRGELSFILGPTGSGKSSFLNSFYGLTKITNGEAEVLGRNLKTLYGRDIPAFRRRMGFVFPDYGLIESWSVNKNLDFTLEAAGWGELQLRKDRIKEVLSGAELYHFGDRLVSKLSKGEKQLIMVARAVLYRPELVLLDNPNAHLDVNSAQKMMAILYSLIKNHGSSVILTTCEESLIRKNPARTYRCGPNEWIELGAMIT